MAGAPSHAKFSRAHPALPGAAAIASVGLVAFSSACAMKRQQVSTEASSERAHAAAMRPEPPRDAPSHALDGEVLALCTVREPSSGTVHKLEFLMNKDLGVFEVDHMSFDSTMQESFRSYFARGVLKRSGIALELQESVTGQKFAELKAEPRGANGLLLGTVVFSQPSSTDQDNAECSVNYQSP